ncbi:MAG: hypothetical protein COV67_11930 [Nitrospinae bacterium CG11_big_fil_rev_8_21_14_0_20_56_8]|nr:MAG: hypothetical protein COV67_11930 [Nitrospinae bacterium CG11_big_fil_rev_8_21_14_0_20_56_8]
MGRTIGNQFPPLVFDSGLNEDPSVNVNPDSKLIVLNMCDFCSREFETCGAQRVFSKSISADNGPLASHEAVVACNRYESPVEVLRRKFH